MLPLIQPWLLRSMRMQLLELGMLAPCAACVPLHCQDSSAQCLQHALLGLQNLDTLALIRRELQKEGYLKTPKVFIHPACSGDMPRLQRIITQLGGELMPSESARPSFHVPVCRQRPCLALPMRLLPGRHAAVWTEGHGPLASCLRGVQVSPWTCGDHKAGHGRDCCSGHAETPGVTHIVCPFGPKGDTDDGVEYMRSLESR